MTPEQETLTEDIILLHKDNNGVFEWRQFIIGEIIKESDGLPYRSIAFVKDELIKKGLIELYLPNDKLTTRLTLKGQDWKGTVYQKAQKASVKRKKWMESAPKRYWYVSPSLVIQQEYVQTRLKESCFQNFRRQSCGLLIMILPGC